MSQAEVAVDEIRAQLIIVIYLFSEERNEEPACRIDTTSPQECEM